jgi:ABC-type transport system involved in cytochrome c biogenesis permease subunit
MQWNTFPGYLNFLRRILVFSIVLGFIATCIGFLAPARFITPTLPYLFVFFIAITLAGYHFILRSAQTKFIRFINTYLLVTIVKLFLFIGVIFIYLFQNRQDAAPFAISFFILYVCYMIFEVVNLVSYFKSSKQ